MLVDSIQTVSSGIVNLVLERAGQRIASGSGFLVDGHVATASHVIRLAPFDVAALRLDDGAVEIRLSSADLLAKVARESDQDHHDLALLALDEPEFAGRFRFQMSPADAAPGQQVVLLGYPFDSPYLAAHVAYVSSVHSLGGTRVLQLDGSANPSNSGGPVIDPESMRAVGWVVRAQTGLQQDFDDLIRTLSGNVDALSQQRASIQIGGVDPVQGLRVSMAAMVKLAQNMKRSANVGIAYASAARHLSEIL